MKRFIFAVLIGWMIFTSTSACHQTTGGPRTWIDQPLEDSIFPIETLILQAHASDSDGISEIHFLIDSQEYKTVTVNGNRMEHAAVEWLPPAYGEYLIGAKAVDNSGNEGAIDISSILISGDAPVVPMPLPGEEIVPLPLPGPNVEGDQATPIEIPGPEVESADEEQGGVAPMPLPGQQEIEEDPFAIANRNANCREGPGTEYDIDGALLLDEQADIVGRLADSSWFLITLPDSALNCWISAITVDTEGNVADVSIASAPPPPPEEEQPAGDTKPPDIFGAVPSKTSMCASDTVNSNVVAYDESGIGRVYANWQITDNGSVVESGSVEYGPISSVENGYTGVFGSFTYTGSLIINGKVVDNAGNSTSFSHTITIDCS